MIMLDEKKIEEAAKLITEKYRYYTTLSNVDRDKVVKSSFSDGAHWAVQEFLKDLWHDASEEPRMFAEVVAEAKITESINTYISFKKSDALFTNWTAYSHGASITRWLYIDDLFPKQKGGE